MPVTVHIPGPLRGYADGATQVVLDAAPKTLLAAIEAVGARFPGVRDRVLDEQGRQRPHVNLFVDREDVRFGGGLETPLRADAVVHILPAVSGGIQVLQSTLAATHSTRRNALRRGRTTTGMTLH